MRKFVLLCFVVGLVIAMAGCETLARKFIRKPKGEQAEEIRMVVVPEEYPAPVISKEELYRQYLLYWQSWQDELIQSLSETNQKKQLACADSAIKNLEELTQLLKPERETLLQPNIARLRQLRTAIAEDISRMKANTNRQEAERIKRDVLRKFSVKHVKDDLS